MVEPDALSRSKLVLDARRVEDASKKYGLDGDGATGESQRLTGKVCDRIICSGEESPDAVTGRDRFL